MKKLGKLTINPDKLLKSEELVRLKGGYPYAVACKDSETGQTCYEFFSEFCIAYMIVPICESACPSSHAYVCVG